MLRRDHVAAMLDGLTPAAQGNWLKALRPLMAFAIKERMRADDPTEGVKAVKGEKSLGHMTWLEPQVTQYREHHKLGTVARVAIELLLNVASRRKDAHLLGRQHISDGRLCWRPSKTRRSTGKMLKVMILHELQAAIDACPAPDGGVLHFLFNDYGKPFASEAAFGNKFADWCNAAGLKPVLCDDGRIRNYRAHGLRKAALLALAQAGCTDNEMMQVSGHSTPAQLQVYLQAVSQEHQSDVAMNKLLASRDQKQHANLQTSNPKLTNRRL
jgi:integrase